MIHNQLSDSERVKFNLGLPQMDWMLYNRLFCYGLSRFVFRDDVQAATSLEVDRRLHRSSTQPLLLAVAMTRSFNELLVYIRRRTRVR